MNSDDRIRHTLAEHTSGQALDDLRDALDMTRRAGRLARVYPDTIEQEINASLQQSLAGREPPAETLRRLRSRWMA